MAENNPDTIAALYSKDAVLWARFRPGTIGPAAVKAYFVGAYKALPKPTVKFGEQLIRVYGNTAVNTGYYTYPTRRTAKPNRSPLATASPT